MSTNRMLQAIVNRVRDAEVARIFTENAKDFAEAEKQIESLNLDGIGYKNMAISFCKSMTESEADLVACARYCCVMWKARSLAAEKGSPVTDQELGLIY